MKFHIKKLYIWFDRNVEPRILKFDNNKVNVITGSSSTGKSNIYAIIDYCLLSGNVNIVYPVINENAQWYGLEFSVNGVFFAIARKKPTVEVIPPEVFMQNEVFASDFYPSNANIHVNDARKKLNKAFGYRNNQEVLFRTCFVFNALTESIITSPYDFLNFKFYGDEKYHLKEERNNLLQFVLTPNMEEYANVKEELHCLKKKKQEVDRYLKKTKDTGDDFNGLLNDLIRKCINANLIDSFILSQDSNVKMNFIEELLKEMSSEAMMQTSQMDKELNALQKKHSEKSIQLRNIKRAQEEYNKYYETLHQVEDSLKPITFIEQHLNVIGTNMWTSHIINALIRSLSKVAENKQNIQQRPLVSLNLITKLEEQITEIDAKIGEITKQKGALYKQVEALKVIGQIEASVERLREFKLKKDKNDMKPEKTLAPEESSRINILEQKLDSLEQKKASIISDLNICIQAIYDELNYMEHYDKCYTKYELKQERLMLNDGKSIINYDVIGSQSNYMFLHLCFFLGLHRYFFEKVSSQVGQFLFIDQPSIPYYAGSDDVKTTDRDKLLDAFKVINTFMNYVIVDKKEEFQIILIEHAPESYWTGENKLDYFTTKDTFTEGNALIPKYVLENK